MTVDFDGSGFGTFHSSSSVPSFSTRCVTCTGTLSLPSGSSQGTDQQVRDFQAARLDEQRQQERLRHEAEQLQEELRQKTQQHLDTLRTLQKLTGILDQLGEENQERARYKLKIQINDAIPRFNAQQQDIADDQVSILQRLTHSIAKINVPPPDMSRHYHSVLLLGALNTPDDAAEALSSGLKDPFVGQRYEKILAFGARGGLDLARASLDHFLGDVDSLSKDTLSRISELQGTTIDELVAHSNGAKVAEVLIRAGVIRSVRVLRILGGDAALMDLPRLENLARDKHVAIYVYATRGDLVPLVPLGWQIREWAEKLGQPLSQFAQAENLTYEVLGIKLSKVQTEASVHVQLLSCPHSADPIENHKYVTYHRIIDGQRRQGCLDGHGTLDRHCTIY